MNLCFLFFEEVSIEDGLEARLSSISSCDLWYFLQPSLVEKNHRAFPLTWNQKVGTFQNRYMLILKRLFFSPMKKFTPHKYNEHFMGIIIILTHLACLSEIELGSHGAVLFWNLPTKYRYIEQTMFWPPSFLRTLSKMHGVELMRIINLKKATWDASLLTKVVH